MGNIVSVCLCKANSADWRVKTKEQSAHWSQFLLTNSALLCYRF